MSAAVWNDWRARYDEMSFEEQVLVYDEIARDDPRQNRYDLDALPDLSATATVTEIGGWTGSLAAIVLDQHPNLTRWTNYEICQWAATEGKVCHDSRYEAVALNDWPWNIDLKRADLFIASHVIEHMRIGQFIALTAQFPRKFKCLHLQIPLPAVELPDWTDYDGTHILEASWREIHVLLRSRGYWSADQGDCRTYTR